LVFTDDVDSTELQMWEETSDLGDRLEIKF